MDNLSQMKDNEIKDLIASNFTFRHKTLEEYIEESGEALEVSKEIDWGEQVGNEVW